mmetsp:Transcript_45143/g.136866  ORF Transcript_45143/g.136866 Transcript_45143/m.136866 type:complete len:255 (+) Transcript_45143:566-1330(+)
MASTNCPNNAAKERHPMGSPRKVLGLAWHAATSLPRSASTPARNSPRNDEYDMCSKFCKSASSTQGCTRVMQLLWLKNFKRLDRTSFADWARSWSWAAVGAARSACSRYSSGVIEWPAASWSSNMKSRNTHNSVGRLASCPCSSMCSAKRHVKASVLKRPSLSAPLVFSTSTDDSNAHRVINCASRCRSLSVLPKPSQSRNASRGLRSSSAPPNDPYSQRPSVHARVVPPTLNSGSPRCTRSSSRFSKKLLPVR